jgi:hypothetical protein
MSPQGKDTNSGCTNFHGAVRKVLDSVGKMYNHTGWTARNLNLNLTSLLVKLFQLNRYIITNKYFCMRFVVLIVVSIQIMGFWDVPPTLD